MKSAIASQKFRKLQLVVYGVVFGLVGYWIWSVSFAMPNLPGDKNLAFPSSPVNLTAPTPPASAVELHWSAPFSSSGPIGYYVIRNGVTISQVKDTSYKDLQIQPGQTYSYVVEAYSSPEKVSGPSNEVSVKISAASAKQDKIAPSAPPDLRLFSVRASQISLLWNAASDNSTGVSYQVFRNNQKVADVSSTSFGDTTVSPDKTYTYWIVARDQAGNQSSPSNKVRITSPKH